MVSNVCQALLSNVSKFIIMTRSATIFVLLLLATNAFSQRKYTTEKTAKSKLVDMLRKGQRLYFNGQFDSSVAELERALKIDPLFIDAQIEWANVKNQQGKYAEAEFGYEKALSIDPGYLPGVIYSLAIVEFDQEKFSEAALHFDQYLKTGKGSPKSKSRAKMYLRNATFADQAIKNKVPFNPVNLGASINTSEDEYLPTLTADGQKLIYTAVRGRQEDFYISQKKEGVWLPAQPIESVNSQYNEGGQSISADGNFLAFTICNRPGGMGRCDLYFTEYINGSWTPVKNFGSPINSAAYESLPSISADAKTLYFNSDRKGGMGNLDVWMSRRQPNGRWGEPENLGTPVNTDQDEQAPFIHPDGQTLYFMSKGHPGMGAYDLYLSRKQPDGAWGEPQNLGYPINTKGNEGAFTVSLDGTTAFYASDIEGGFGKTDIHSFPLHEAARPQPVTYVKALVTDDETGDKLISKVEIIDLQTGQIHASSKTDQDGKFLITLPMGKDYALNVSKEGYLFHSENFALKEIKAINEPYEMNISLSPIPEVEGGEITVTKPVILKNVFFETGSAELKNESLTELNRLKKLLEENSAMNIQVGGHTDDVGSEEDNLNLSENRAKSVYVYLVNGGISERRLSYKGFGETKPIASNDTEEGRKKNRRTEFVVVQ